MLSVHSAEMTEQWVLCRLSLTAAAAGFGALSLVVQTSLSAEFGGVNVL